MSAGLGTRKCILITGATSGIGRALALALAELPSKPTVIAAGRRQTRLDELKAKGLQTVSLDVTNDQETLTKNLEGIIQTYPELDAVILCAGIQFEVELDQPKAFKNENLLREFYVNYTANVFAINTILPHFQKLATEGRHTSIVPVTSGLAMLPIPWLANYAATKAALHSYTISLQATFKDTPIHVTELVPPLVESELHDDAGTTEALSKRWMPLEEFIELTMPGLVNGDLVVHAGMATQLYNKFNEGERNVLAENALQMHRTNTFSAVDE